MKNVYSTLVSTINGEEKDLPEYQEKVLLIVNVASQCRFKPKYKDLQKLYEKFHRKGFEILAFPCIDFAW